MSRHNSPSDRGSQDSYSEQSQSYAETRSNASSQDPKDGGILHLVVNSEGEIDPSLISRRTGWIYKKGGSVNDSGFGRRNWKKRWFVLKPIPFFENTGYELQYFDGSRSGRLKGTVNLVGAEIFCEKGKKEKKGFYEFQIGIPNGKVLQLYCEKESERMEWMDTLYMVSLYLKKLSSGAVMGVDGYDPELDDVDEIYQKGEDVAQSCQVLAYRFNSIPLSIPQCNIQ